MALVDDLNALKPVFRTFADWLASGPAEGPDVLDMMRDERISIEGIVAALRKNNIPCSKSTVRAYRDGTL